MKKKFTQQDINLFFSLFKELPQTYKLEQVHQLINNPDAKAMHSVKLNHKPLKFIIMTSTFITVAIILLCWLTPTKDPDIANQQANKHAQNGSRVSLSSDHKEEITEPEESQDWQPGIPAGVTHASMEKNTNRVKNEISISLVKPEVNRINNTIDKQLPVDTTIDGHEFIVSLSDAELQRLGFFLDETGLYYKNNFRGRKVCFHSRWESNSGEITNIVPFENNRNRKVEWSAFDFYPVITSTISFTANEVKQHDFYSMNDTLLPVLIKNSQLKYQIEKSKNLIIWFKVSDQLFGKLPQHYLHLQAVYEKISKLKKQHLNTDLVKYEAKSITAGLKLIELSQSELQKLGFVFKEHEISYNTPLFEINLFAEGQGIAIHEDGDDASFYADKLVVSGNDRANKTDYAQIKLIYLSNEYGEHNVQWIGPDDDREKNTFEYFHQKAQFLVPVYLRRSVYPKQLYQDQVFWFEPSMALFDAMPDSIGQQLKREYIYITTGDKGPQNDLSTVCVYFEACRSTLDIDEFKIYPNPANTAATIEFFMPVSSAGHISLVNISGTQVKYLIPTTNFSHGINSFAIDVSDVPPGIYLVLVSTDNGFKTQRLIINR